MMRRLLAIGLALVFVASATFAADLPPGKWWRRPDIVQALGLSAEQQERLETIFRGAANELIDRRGEVEKETIALRAELDKAQLDRHAIQVAGAKLNEARGRLFQRELAMLVDMRGVLTDTQWNTMRARLDSFQQQQQQQRPNMRRRQ